jgi:hypothetical protein
MTDFFNPHRRALALALDLDLRHHYDRADVRPDGGPPRHDTHTYALADAIHHLDGTLNNDGDFQYAFTWHASARNLRDMAEQMDDTRRAELYRLAAEEIDPGASYRPEPVAPAPEREPDECAGCGAPIRQVDMIGWVDADTPDSACLVYCNDQDETHDGIRHAPAEPEPADWRDNAADAALERFEAQRKGEL